MPSRAHLSRLSRLFQNRFLHDHKGVVAIVFALSALPMLGLTGLAVDYAGAARVRGSITRLADAATLFSVSDQTIKPELALSLQKDVAQKAAEKEFNGLISNSDAKSSLSLVTVTTEIADSTVKVRLCYEGQYKTAMLGAIGISSMDFSGCSEAISAQPTYVSVFALVDASGSMGIGATRADQDLMRKRMGCEFACHTTGSTATARQIGAKTRFDVVQGALTKVVDQAQAISRVPGQYKLAIYKFSNYLTSVQDSTDALPSVKTKLQMMEQDKEGAGTNFHYVLPDFTAKLPKSGDGRSRENPKVFALILTDGIESSVYERPQCYYDPRKPCTYAGQWSQDPRFVSYTPGYWDGSIRNQVLNPKLCDALKSKGVIVMVLNTEYVTDGSTNGHALNIGRILKPSIPAAIRGCASASNLAYSANSGPDVESAINQMFTAVVQKARVIR